MYRAPPRFMKLVSMRELDRQAGQVIKRLEEGGEPFVITKRGRAVAVLFPCASNAPAQPVVAIEPPLPIPEGIQLQVFQVMDDTQKTADRVAYRTGLASGDVAVTLSRLEIAGYITRRVMGYSLSKRGAELAEWMQRGDA